MLAGDVPSNATLWHQSSEDAEKRQGSDWTLRRRDVRASDPTDWWPFSHHHVRDQADIYFRDK